MRDDLLRRLLEARFTGLHEVVFSNEDRAELHLMAGEGLVEQRRRRWYLLDSGGAKEC
jgi:hypothetical protein